MNKHWLLLNPPTGLYIRDARCQAAVNGAFATSQRPPVDLGYIAGTVTSNGDKVVIMDCEVEHITWEDIKKVFNELTLDYVVINTTMFTFQEDLKICTYVKNMNSYISTIVKGSIRYDFPEKCIEANPDVDILVLHGEEEVFDLLSKGFDWSEIHNIIFQNDGKVQKNPTLFKDKLELSLPRFDLIKHELYRRPDTNEKQATIVVGRGCPGQCIYCIAPIVNGRRAIYRDINHIMLEIDIYYKQYGIISFYFCADNFVQNKTWVMEFCRRCKELPYKIQWLCTSRIDNINKELITEMKRAGCYGVSIGIESGNAVIQKHIKKNLDIRKIPKTIRLYQKNNIICLTHFILGFPWDNNETIKETIRFAKKANGNIVEFYVATPLPGTELYELVKNDWKLSQDIDTSYINYNTSLVGTYFLEAKKIEEWRKKAIRSIYYNPFFYLRSLKYIKSWKQLYYCIKFFFVKLLHICLKKQNTAKGCYDGDS